MAKESKDTYANVAYGTITMSAANTLTWSQIQMGISINQKVALCLHRILWVPSVASEREIVAATDGMNIALTTSSRLTAITDVSDPAIISFFSKSGIAATTEPSKRPYISDFSGLPGGGKLIPPNPLWLAMSTEGFVAAGIARIQLDFTFITLSDADFLELLAAVYPANVA
jgi:hypothetical protein